MVIATMLIMSLSGDTASASASAITKLMSSSNGATAANYNDDGQSTVMSHHAVLKRSFNPYFGGWSSSAPSAAFGGPAKNPWNSASGGGDVANGNEWAAYGGAGASALLDTWNG